MKRILFFIFSASLFSFSAHSYVDGQSVYCGVNGNRKTKVTCGEGWEKMRGYREIKVRLNKCSDNWSSDKIMIQADGEKKDYDYYDVIAEEGIEIDSYFIECVER